MLRNIGILLIFLCIFYANNALALDFFEAAKQGRVSIVKEYVRNGADANEKDSAGKTAIEYAVENDHPITARFLMQHMDAIDSEDMLGLLWRDKYELFKFYYDNKVHQYHHESAERTFLTTAAMYGAGEAVLFMLKNNIGGDINARDVDGETALIAASYDFSGDSESSRERAEVLRHLLKYKANINARNNEGKSALMLATHSMGSERIYNTLLKANADVNIQDNKGMTVLMYNAQLGYRPDDPEETAENLVLLLKYKAKIDIKDNTGKTALMHAAKEGYAGGVKVLLANGADPHVKDNQGNTALSYALFHKHKNTAEILMNADN